MYDKNKLLSVIMRDEFCLINDRDEVYPPSRPAYDGAREELLALGEDIKSKYILLPLSKYVDKVPALNCFLLKGSL